MDQQSSASSANTSGISTLTKSLARKIPPKVLIPALLEMWDSLQGSENIVSSHDRVHVLIPTYAFQSRISAFFDAFGRALQHADRPTVLDYLRDIFKIFLEALDIVKAHDEVSSNHTQFFCKSEEKSRPSPGSSMLSEKWSSN
jgi:U3 small nucleolar RNA-associated protein 10